MPVPKKIISILTDLLSMTSREDLISAIQSIPQSAIDAGLDDASESEGEELPPKAPLKKAEPKAKVAKEPKVKAEKPPRAPRVAKVQVEGGEAPAPKPKGKRALTDEQKAKMKEGRTKKKTENALQLALDQAVESHLPVEDAE